jgi:protein-S-isoprenylcysteine O-methyltransferase Ste14
MSTARYKGRVFVFIQFGLITAIVVSAELENNFLKHESILFLNIISILLIALSAVCLIAALYYFRQPITPNPYPMEKAALRTNGIYSLIRHPMYLSAILFLTGYTLYRSSYYTLLLCALSSVFILVKINWEEKYLGAKYKKYDDYRKMTKKLIPFIY